MKEFAKSLIISLTFLSFFFSLGVYNYINFGEVSGNSDFEWHWDKIHDLSVHPEYPSFYHFVFQLFNSNKLLFYSANLFLICLIIPSLVFYATKTWWGTLIYFCGISLPHMWLYGSTYPQALAFAFLLIYLCKRKNPIVFILCASFASLVHREGSYLFAIVFVAEVIDFLFKKRIEVFTKKLKEHLKNKLFGLNVVPVILGVQKFNDWGHYFFYLLTQVSPLVWFFSKKIFLQPFYLILALTPLFLLNYDARIISLTEIVLLLVVTPEIVKSKHKKLIAFFLLIQLVFFILEFTLGTSKLIQNN